MDECKPLSDGDDKFSAVVVGLTLCGLCASIDPERDGVKDAVHDSKTAGVRVVMITGRGLHSSTLQLNLSRF